MPVSRKHETCRRLSCPRTAGYSRRTALAAPVVEAKEKLVNDRHPSGTATSPAPASDAASAHYASYGTQEAAYGDFTTYATYDATGFQHTTQATGTFEADPLFGAMPGDSATGAYDSGQWAATGHHTPHYDAYAAQHHAAYDSGVYESTAWSAEYQQLSSVPPQSTPSEDSGQWDAGAWNQPQQPADATQHWEWGTQTFDTGAYDATQWNSGGATAGADDYEHRAESFSQPETATFEQVATDDPTPYGESYDEDPHGETTSTEGELTATGELPAVTDLLDDQEEPGPVPGSRAAARNASRSRRRAPARRSALLTVAVPSACVMGVAGIAAASVGTLTGGDEKDTNTTAADTGAVKPSAANDKLDTQLEILSAGADDFADRASRTQERIDLKAQQEAERKKAAEEAARKERLRPKFALPVAQHGLSAYYGQAGINWMSVHTGIDFPVSYGSTVMAATDGTVRTQWNSAYGNMMIVTAKDGTETWYCHLSTYQVASGTTVKAGDTIAFSGNSGNSTGPHLHFEVRPGGGSAIDPLAWFRSHGLDPS
ncbi:MULTISPECIES: M23 family metallopeptidase [unclassified Streptomyces]|uniref:M23 family metallopeptidase n=1 Tax=unclassified Streptomyces TaxID=2593676 RepID=UPI00202ECA1A|nr:MULTISPECIES: M23 family metallopeptidase [unclassified Streptomyces]MCM1970258.1 M23 family metallopeptidase [Streptomyces sp. G1]